MLTPWKPERSPRSSLETVEEKKERSGRRTSDTSINEPIRTQLKSNNVQMKVDRTEEIDGADAVYCSVTLHPFFIVAVALGFVLIVVLLMVQSNIIRISTDRRRLRSNKVDILSLNTVIPLPESYSHDDHFHARPLFGDLE